MTTTETQ